MIGLRQFTMRDAEVLRDNGMPDASIEEVEGMISAWASGSFRGRYFEMFALTAEGAVVGSVSLYEHTKSVASIGAEVFAGERGRGYASEGMRLVIEKAASLGYRVIMDQVRADNAASIALHEKLGFETDGYRYKNAGGAEVLIYILCL